MKAPSTDYNTKVLKLASTYIATASEPDARQQAPFEVGDYIIFSGIIVHDSVLNEDYISAYEIEANLGIYTQPRTLPSYVAIGEFGVGSADPNLTAINGADQEAQERIFFETEITDILTPVDAYMVDVDPATGVEHNRWVSQNGITAECNTDLLPVATGGNCLGITGGINTQFYQAQPQRARIRVAKAPNGILTRPSRNMRAMVRTMCKPYTASTTTTAQAQSTIAAMFDANGWSRGVTTANNPDLCLTNRASTVAAVVAAAAAVAFRRRTASFAFFLVPTASVALQLVHGK